MRIDAVLFDCDGVLVDSEVVGLNETIAVLSARGFSFTPAEFLGRFIGMRNDLFLAGLRAAYDEVSGSPVSDAAFATLIEDMVAARRAQRHTMAAVAGAHEAVREAGAARLALAVASSSARVYLDDKIERFGFRPHFGAHVYSADAVAHGKPAPDIFLHAANGLGVDPQHCLVIEDSPAGVTAARAAGMAVWGFTGGAHCLSGHAERLAATGASRLFADHGALAAAFAAMRSSD